MFSKLVTHFVLIFLIVFLSLPVSAYDKSAFEINTYFSNYTDRLGNPFYLTFDVKSHLKYHRAKVNVEEIFANIESISKNPQTVQVGKIDDFNMTQGIGMFSLPLKVSHNGMYELKVNINLYDKNGATSHNEVMVYIIAKDDRVHVESDYDRFIGLIGYEMHTQLIESKKRKLEALKKQKIIKAKQMKETAIAEYQKILDEKNVIHEKGLRLTEEHKTIISNIEKLKKTLAHTKKETQNIHNEVEKTKNESKKIATKLRKQEDKLKTLIADKVSVYENLQEEHKNLQGLVEKMDNLSKSKAADKQKIIELTLTKKNNKKKIKKLTQELDSLNKNLNKVLKSANKIDKKLKDLIIIKEDLSTKLTETIQAKKKSEQVVAQTTRDIKEIKTKIKVELELKNKNLKSGAKLEKDKKQITSTYKKMRDSRLAKEHAEKLAHAKELVRRDKAEQARIENDKAKKKSLLKEHEIKLINARKKLEEIDEIEDAIQIIKAAEQKQMQDAAEKAKRIKEAKILNTALKLKKKHSLSMKKNNIEYDIDPVFEKLDQEELDTLQKANIIAKEQSKINKIKELEQAKIQEKKKSLEKAKKLLEESRRTNKIKK